MLLQRSLGNSAVAGLMVQRQEGTTATQTPATPSPAATPTTRAEAETQLRQRFGVGRVFEGALADQARRMNTNRMDTFGSAEERQDIPDMLNAAGWQAWSPPDGSPIWGWLVNSFSNFDRTFGGVPQAREIVFFKTDYSFVPPDRGGPRLVPDARTGAQFGGGSMTIYETAEAQATAGRVRTSRSTAAGSMGGGPQQPATTAQAGFEFTIQHEMGHGLGEAVATSVEPRVFSQFGQHVGWRSGRLYDQGVEDEAHLITRRNWNSAGWQDQPLSEHSLSNVGEDFAESIAAFATQPQALRDRSPRRHEFIQNNLDSFRRAMQAARGQGGGG
jgi:hypothetical protein